MHYAIHEGTFALPDTAVDRTVNMLFLNAGPGGPSLVVSRGTLRDGEDVDAFLAREWEVATRKVKDIKIQGRQPVKVGAAGWPGVQTEFTHEEDGRTFHQMQTAFQAGSTGQMIVMTLTCAAPFTDEQRAIAQRMLDTFQPRAVIPTLVPDSDRS